MKSEETSLYYSAISKHNYWGWVLWVCGILSLLPVGYLVLTWPPTIASQGIAHRIFYFHVPTAWVALYAPLLSAVCALLYLYTRRELYDIWSLASARIAYLFSIAVLLSGPLWAITEWGTYWNWKDARLISFFILVLALSSYFLLSYLSQDVERERTIRALLSILAAVAAGLTWFAIRWIEPDTHPPAVLDKLGPRIRQSFWLAVLVWHFIFWSFLRLAIRHESLRRNYNYIQAAERSLS